MITVILLTVAALVWVAYLVYVIKAIRGDGYGLSLRHRQPPRSHPRDDTPLLSGPARWS